jgi:hypothetical protein
VPDLGNICAQLLYRSSITAAAAAAAAAATTSTIRKGRQCQLLGALATVPSCLLWAVVAALSSLQLTLCGAARGIEREGRGGAHKQVKSDQAPNEKHTAHSTQHAAD